MVHAEVWSIIACRRRGFMGFPSADDRSVVAPYRATMTLSPTSRHVNAHLPVRAVPGDLLIKPGNSSVSIFSD